MKKGDLVRVMKHHFLQGQVGLLVAKADVAFYWTVMFSHGASEINECWLAVIDEER